jgi:hypothetical protein
LSADTIPSLVVEPFGRVGQEVRTMHRYGFRSGSWALVKAWVEDAAEGPCWLVEFPDGVTDWWRCDDVDGQYEYRSAASPVDYVDEIIVMLLPRDMTNAVGQLEGE